MMATYPIVFTFSNFLIISVPGSGNSQSNNQHYLQVTLSLEIICINICKKLNYLLDLELNHKIQQISIGKLLFPVLGKKLALHLHRQCQVKLNHLKQERKQVSTIHKSSLEK